MKSWSRALATLTVGYLIAIAVGWATFTTPVLMWVLTFTLMPVVFACLAYAYFRSTRPNPGEAKQEAVRLTLLWVVSSFILDALVFIAVIPLTFGAKANWTFFIDQSPWIWFCYIVLVPIVFCGYHFYKKKLPHIVVAGEA